MRERDATSTTPHVPATVDDVNERDLIARVQQQLPSAPDWLLTGIGDDAAVVLPERNRVEVLSVDAVVEGVHFDRAFVPARAVGYRALAVNLSDLAAMGAVPRAALLSFVVPSALPLEDFDELVAGLTGVAATHRVHVIGGNLTRTTGPLVIDITVTGSAKRRQTLLRNGARPGDDIYVSGAIGAAGAGFEMLKAARTRAATNVAATCAQRYLYPEPRVRLGLLLSRNKAASACIDLSDGLADGLHRIADASGVGMVVDADAVPIDPAAREWFESCGADPTSAAMKAGDDYELLFTLAPRTRRRLTAALHHAGVPLTRIGSCTADRSMVLRHPSRGADSDQVLPRVGYDHFR